MKYGKLLEKILEYENTGVLYRTERNPDSERLFDFIELEPTKRGFEVNLMSYRLEFLFHIKPYMRHLPRKKKKKLTMHFKKHYKKLKKEIDRM